MIVISGALVIVALALLIAGLVVSGGLALVYASIGVSVVSAVFLLLGVRQRRPVAVAPGGEGAAAPAMPATPATPAAPAAPSRAVPESGAPAAAGDAVTAEPGPVAEAAPLAALAAEEPEVRIVRAPEPEPEPAARTLELGPGEVLVVPGRPRYHLAGCRYLAGRETEVRTRADALAEGFQACAACRPDEGVVPAATPPAAEPAAEPAAPATARLRTSRKAVSPPTPASERAVAAADPAAATQAVSRPRAASRKQAAAPAATEPATGATAPPPAAAARPRRAETVVVIPDRGRYHRPDCRFVRDAPNTEELTKPAARRAGYQPCGVCKP